MTKRATKWWNIRKLTAIAAAAAGMQVSSAAEILIYGDIGESWWEETVSAKSFISELQAVDAEAITVRINSIGGSVPDGLAIYNAIKRHSATVTTVVDGMAFSIASLIACAGDKRQMASNAMWMAHAPWTYMAGNSAELREMADQLDTWASAMATSYASASGKSHADCLALLTDGKDHYLTAEQAKAEGYIDTITDAQEPSAMAMAVGMLGVSSRYRDVPAAWLQACGGEAAAPAAAPSAASAAPTQENAMKILKSPLLAGLLMMAAGEHGAPSGTGGGAPAPAPNAGAQPGAVSDEQRQSVLAAERQRSDAIVAAFKPFASHAGVNELMAECTRDASITPDAAGRKLLAHLGEKAVPVGAGGVQTIADSTDKRRSAIQGALLVRAGYGSDEDKKNINANPYRGRHLVQIAEASLNAAGVRTELMDQMQIVGMAFTQGTSDFPVLLENTLHKVLEAAYKKKALTYRKWCKIGQVSDFREHKRLRLGSIGNLVGKNELGEYKHVPIPDAEKQGISAGTKGLIITISREAIINNDLGGLTDQAQEVGWASARTVETDAYATLLSNAGAGPTMSDGLALFHANHGNIVAAGPGAPSSAQFKEMRRLIGFQKEHTNTDFLDLTMSVGLFPLGMDEDAKLVNENEYEISTGKNQLTKNISRGTFREIVGTPRLSGTAYYGFADPEECAAIEVVFLNGKDTPYTETHRAFNTDGGALKAVLDFGVGGHNWRGAVKNPGV